MLDFLKRAVIFVIGVYILLIVARIVFSQLPLSDFAKGISELRSSLQSIGGGGSSRTSSGSTNGTKTTTTQTVATPKTTKGFEKAITLKINRGEMVRDGEIIDGVAPTSWFYEGTFSIKFVDEKGNEVGRTQSRSSSSVDSKNTAFIAQVIINDKYTTQTGYAVFQKANITGNSKNDAQFVWPITFPITERALTGTTTNGGSTGGDASYVEDPNAKCFATGCSNQICATKEMYSACDWKPEYSCYQAYGVCERAQGKCGFRETPELTACINGFRGVKATTTPTSNSSQTTNTNTTVTNNTNTNTNTNTGTTGGTSSGGGDMFSGGTR